MKITSSSSLVLNTFLITILLVFSKYIVAEDNKTSIQLLSEGRKLVKEKNWIVAKEKLTESFDKQKKAETAYLLAMVSYNMNDVDAVMHFAEEAISILPKLPDASFNYAKKYIRWATLKESTKTRTTSFEFSSDCEKTTDVNLQAAEVEEKKILLSLETELGIQQAVYVISEPVIFQVPQFGC